MPLYSERINLSKQYQTDNIINISGSRESESAKRSANLALRNETADTPVMTSLGLSQPIIMDWTLNDIWSLFSLINDDEIESFSDNFDLMRKHYSAGNGGVCDLFAGDTNKHSKSCGARFGCVLCGLSGTYDKSLEAQIETDVNTYGYLKPLNDLRTFMINTLWDFNHRSLLGKQMKDGFIKVGINHYSIKYRMDLLRYILTIQNEEYCRTGNHRINLIDIEELIAIQYHWSRSGDEPKPGMAFRIWHEIVEDDNGCYPIPETTFVEKQFTPEYMYFDLEHYVKLSRSQGLDDDALDGKFRHLAREYTRDHTKHRVVRYTESNTFRVNHDEGRAMMFVTSFFPTLVEDGHLDDKCPTVMLKHLLESGVVEISKGSISRLNEDAKRSQTINSLRSMSGIPVSHVMLAMSVSKRVMKEIISRRSINDAEEIQPSLL